MASEKVWSPAEMERAGVLVDARRGYKRDHHFPHSKGQSATARLCADFINLQCELTEAVELLRLAVDNDDRLGMVVACNTQDPDMHEEECPEGYINECGRCEYVHEIRRLLMRNTEAL